jgi:hypothetical protein
MRRIRDGDSMVTTKASFISERRNYPVGTKVTVCQPPRDLDGNGYVRSDVWVWVRAHTNKFETNGTELGYHPDSLEHAPEKRRTA